jgi:predicted NAD-dependent protein-ADP-ribosyltransferase YbiA (DUF1768 family)
VIGQEDVLGPMARLRTPFYRPDIAGIPPVRYDSVEQFIQGHRVATLGSMAFWNIVAHALNPADARAQGAALPAEQVREGWPQVARHVARGGIYYRLANDPQAMKALMMTGAQPLVVEGDDPYWFAQRGEDGRWFGHNEYGRMLTEARDRGRKAILGRRDYAQELLQWVKDALAREQDAPGTLPPQRAFGTGQSYAAGAEGCSRHPRACTWTPGRRLPLGARRPRGPALR